MHQFEQERIAERKHAEAAKLSPAPKNDDCDAAMLDEIAGAMSDEQRIKLADLRGGCLCHLSPPCFACTEPLTMDEADLLGLLT